MGNTLLRQDGRWVEPFLFLIIYIYHQWRNVHRPHRPVRLPFYYPQVLFSSIIHRTPSHHITLHGMALDCSAVHTRLLNKTTYNVLNTLIQILSRLLKFLYHHTYRYVLSRLVPATQFYSVSSI